MLCVVVPIAVRGIWLSTIGGNEIWQTYIGIQCLLLSLIHILNDSTNTSASSVKFTVYWQTSILVMFFLSLISSSLGSLLPTVFGSLNKRASKNSISLKNAPFSLLCLSLMIVCAVSYTHLLYLNFIINKLPSRKFHFVKLQLTQLP